MNEKYLLVKIVAPTLYSAVLHFEWFSHFNNILPIQITDCASCRGLKDRHQTCSKCMPDAKDPKDAKESKCKLTNWSKKFNCVKILSPKSSSHIHQQQQQPSSSSSSSSSKSNRLSVSTEIDNFMAKELKSLKDKLADEALKRLLDFEK